MSEDSGIFFDKVNEESEHGRPPERVIGTSINLKVFKQALTQSRFCCSYTECRNSETIAVIRGNGTCNNVRIRSDSEGYACVSLYPYVENTKDSFDRIAEIVCGAAHELQENYPLKNLYEELEMNSDD